MTQRDHKLEFERRMAQAVGRHAGACNVVHGDRPDAVLTVGDLEIGLEIVSLHANDWAQATSMMLGQLRPKIEEELKSRGLNYFVQYEIEVPEHFPPGEENLDKATRKARNDWRNTLPTRIADVAASGPIDLNREQLSERGITRLVRLTIEPREQGPLALPGYWWSSPPPQTLAEELLRSKEAKLPGYRGHNPQLAEFWLALGPFGPGTVEDGYAWLMDGHYTTDFNRILLVDPNNDNVIDVSPKPVPHPQ